MCEYLVLMGDSIWGDDGSDGERLGGRCDGGVNSGAYGDRENGYDAGTAVLSEGLEAAGDEW